ncbi:uncharacterized protein LOC117606093 [Osmia lignaria lignaria]|uniref:uncharacterized protein LOC117606093 n=1 Tax=Osmia lignaria lignaria TaxID=1437193 RepID=UPI00402B7E04
MDYENENTNESYQYYELDEQMKDVKSKLLECQSKCEDTIIEMCNVSQLKDKGTFVLKDVVRKYNDLDKELYQIHCNYIKCAEKIDSHEEYIIRKIKTLTLQRDNLKEELSEIKRKADENDKILTEIRKMITIQEKKNTALIRKLRKQVENMHISPNLEGKVNTILNDPRVTNTKISKQ